MMTAEQLKGSILQLAMQGKLVEQRPEEGTGEELYKEIQHIKERLIKKGRIKKDKKFTDLITTEYPFDIPETWKWVKFGSVMNVVSARRVHQADWKNCGVPFYRAREIAKLAETGSVENELFISEELYEEFSKSGVPEPGDLMVTGVGTLGKTYVVKEGDKFYYKDASVLCFENYADLEPFFIKQIMESPSMKGQIKSNSSGTTVATLTMVRMVEYLIPLPPLAEQKRIVAKIEELMPFVEQYAAASTKLNTLNASFPEMMKKSILQEAVQGKLVLQDPNDEPASLLLKKIAEEKKRLIKEGKIKKLKPLPEITEDEIPFNIPESWEWARLASVCYDLRYGTSSKSSKTGEMVVLRMGNIQNGEIDYSDLVYSSDSIDNEKYKLDPLDILFNRTNSRELVGKTGIYRGELPAIFAGYLVQIRPIIIDPEYLNYVMNSEYERNYCKDVKSDGINQSNVNATKIGQFVIPVPPLGEQKRIVESLNKALPDIKKYRQAMDQMFY